ncbi:hypothetical protein [Membranihabitans maritimus]|uniref:hypothetical protein n=1 Tax=Membranihabitans maritimus TaxID=2904244 RepID=UPI001F3A7240|nr:hypothetical protein [Membranihabitans maritimus]
MRLIYIPILLLFLFVVRPVTAQENISIHTRSNEVYGELLGTGGAYSLNYGRHLLGKGSVQGWVKIGGGYLGQLKALRDLTDYSMVSAHIEPGILWGKGRNQLEAGISYTYIYYFDITRCIPEHPGCHMYSHFIIPRLGYRHYTKSGRWFFSIAWTPVFEIIQGQFGVTNKGDTFPLFGGLGIGWRF